MADSVVRRAADRLAVNASANIAFAGPVAEDYGPAKIRDVSMQEIGMVLYRQVPIGTLLVVNLAHANQKIAKTTLVRVTQVTPINGGFFIAGTFAEPLSYQELTTLVM